MNSDRFIMSDMDELVNSISKLLAVGEKTSEKEKLKIESSAKCDENFRNDLINSNIIGSSKKKIDPKIRNAKERLPIFKRKDELLQVLLDNQILIVIGKTGSGKTTQLPQYLKEIGLGIKGRIGCTQLRRMAAKAVATRVAREQECKLGEEVGYTIRFDDCTCPTTQIQYMTDGILLRECTYDRTLTSYSAVMLDESHERTVDTDILLGVLRWIMEQRNDLKLIISSATLDAEKFSSYFFNAKIFNISEGMFPVEKIYWPMCSRLDYVDNAVKVVIHINEIEEAGDIIIFMSGESDIEELHDKLKDYRNSLYPTLVVLPCYSALPWEEQAKIFEQAEKGTRKVVIATNIAETSLTVDGIRYVIDSGYVKQKVYNNKEKIEVLRKLRVSKAQAIQRKGRAGRVAPGKCYRLYSEEEFEKFVSGPEPEIQRTSLTNAVLMLKKIGFKDISVFHFIDEPPPERIQQAEAHLKKLEAINDNGEITEIGKKMASFPLDPTLAKMLIVSEKEGCAEEILTIVALVSVGNIFIRPRRYQKQADAAKASFFTNDGDLLTMLLVYNKWSAYEEWHQLAWCKENFVHHRFLYEAFKIREQLHELMVSRDMTIKSAGFNRNIVLKCICSGFMQNLAQKVDRFTYKTLPEMEQVFIHPGSSLFRVSPPWVVYEKVLQTKKPYMRGVSPVNIDWIPEFASKPTMRFIF